MNKTKIKLLSKSPFMTGLVGGAGAVVADLIWLSGELSLHANLISDHAYLLVRFGVLGMLVLSLLVCVYAGYLYLTNGYMRADNEIFKEHRLKDNKRNKLSKIK